MASVLNTARLSARAVSRYAPRRFSRRGFRVSACDRTAQNYAMPALSPTMTEGNIASWRVKEGDSFSAGDVLLEIETDKATMDVEAQDDGVLVKITQGDGAKGVKVGQRIAVTADAGDDINSLELPAEDGSSEAQSTKSETSKHEGKDGSKDSSASGSEQPAQTSQSQPAPSNGGDQPSSPQKQRYPLYPSVAHILHQNGLSSEDAEKIPATGPQGRLLKGDVLAYLGKISKDYPAKSSARLEKLAHLDLSNIQIAPPPKPAASTQEAASDAQPPADSDSTAQETEIALHISLSSVLATQKRVHDSLGIFLPLSTFIARASELANDDLPARVAHRPTADELFDAVLGLDKGPAARLNTSRGHFFPTVSAISSPPPPLPSVRRPDIIDLLTTNRTRTSAPPKSSPPLADNDKVFSVVARDGDEARAAEFLARVKLALETEPGRLVL